MARKSTFGGEATQTPPAKIADKQPTGSGSKSGQFPGVSNPEIMPHAEVVTDRYGIHGDDRGVDPALQGHIVHGREQGPTPGKDQVKDPNEPTMPAAGGTLGRMGGQFPGIEAALEYTCNPSEPGRGNASGPQPRETPAAVGAVRGGQFPGVPQKVEDLPDHGGQTEKDRDVMGIDGVLAPRHVASGTADVGLRHVQKDVLTEEGTDTHAGES